MPVFFMAKGC